MDHKGLRAVISALLVGLCALIYYLTLPAVTLRSAGFWGYLILCTTVGALLATIWLFDWLEEKVFWGFSVPAALLVLLMIFAFASSNIFHANHAQKIANVKVSDLTFEEAFPDLANSENLANLALVDLDTAKMLGDKKMASLENASWYDVDDEYNLIQYQGRYYRMSGIDYGDFFKFRKARDYGLPGYVLVECTPENGKVTQEAQLVTLDKPMRYSPGAFWDKDLTRHLRGQYPHDIFGKSFLEIDETGTPYWITAVEEPTAFIFGDLQVTGFILTDAATGASQKFDAEDVPEWVDHAYSLSYLMEIAEWHYSYVDGWWNSIASKTGVLNTSYSYRDNSSKKSDSEAGKFANFYGYSSFVDKDGNVMFYTGLTPANSAESNVGWLVINPRTGEMTQYNVQGAEESSAQGAVEQLVQAQKYEATFPLPCNIGGHPTYVMCLKGKSGLCAGYALCNVENFSIATQAETLDQAIAQYLKLLGNDDSGNGYVYQEGDVELQAGKVAAMWSAVIDGNTYYYYQLDVSSIIYRASVKVNEHQGLIQEGDWIRFFYSLDGSYEITEIWKIDPPEKQN